MNNNKEKEHPDKRDFELENIAGNLLIVEYQVGKPKDRVVDKIRARQTFALDKGLHVPVTSREFYYCII